MRRSRPNLETCTIFMQLNGDLAQMKPCVYFLQRYYTVIVVLETMCLQATLATLWRWYYYKMQA